MSRVLRRRWPSSLDVGLSRRDRQGCEYEAYVPDLLIGRTFRLDGSIVKGPATSPQPSFDARTHEGKIQIRRR